MKARQSGAMVITASAAGLLMMMQSAPYTVTKHASVASPSGWPSTTAAPACRSTACARRGCGPRWSRATPGRRRRWRRAAGSSNRRRWPRRWWMPSEPTVFWCCPIPRCTTTRSSRSRTGTAGWRACDGSWPGSSAEMSTRQPAGRSSESTSGGTKLLAVRLDPDGGVTADHFQASPTDGPGRRPGGGRCRPPAVRPRRGRRGGAGCPRPGGQHRIGALRPQPARAGRHPAHRRAAATPSPGGRSGSATTPPRPAGREHDRGAAQGADEVLMVTLGTGIGGGIVSGGPADRRGQPLCRGVRPHGRRSARAPVPLRQARVLGAVRVRQRAGRAGPRDGDRRRGAPPGRPGRRRPRSGAGRARHRRGRRRATRRRWRS